MIPPSPVNRRGRLRSSLERIDLARQAVVARAPAPAHAACSAASTASSRSPLPSSTSERSRARSPSRRSRAAAVARRARTIAARAAWRAGVCLRVSSLLYEARVIARAASRGKPPPPRDPVAIAQRRDAHACSREAWCAFEEHQRDGRVDELERRMRRAGRSVARCGTCRRPVASRDTRRAPRAAPRAQCRAMAHQRIHVVGQPRSADGVRGRPKESRSRDPRPGVASSRSNAAHSCSGSSASSRTHRPTGGRARPRSPSRGAAAT